MKNRFNLIIFDWDGTLSNSIDWIVGCLQKAAARCHCPVPEPDSARQVIGLSIDRAIETLFPDADAPTRKWLIECYTAEYRARELDRDDLFPGVYDMLVQLQDAGYRLAVATGKTRRGLDRALHATDTKELFCITRCADETASKPDPGMLKEIIRYADIAPERALMVGDTVHDLQMAENARISSVAVACGAHPESLLQRYRPLQCLQQPTELLKFI
ncbi:HAD-IIIA family hydrolase [Methylosarcina fibrata]|uniref:HAD-IIIA family hydrolase n=1 Tax=Methylosarcina fibrata TaxID=105972 RepID=UPI000380B78C|nr:HAD-IIIA family hydrolase [Methylosarcina fibrata]